MSKGVYEIQCEESEQTNRRINVGREEYQISIRNKEIISSFVQYALATGNSINFDGIKLSLKNNQKSNQNRKTTTQSQLTRWQPTITITEANFGWATGLKSSTKTTEAEYGCQFNSYDESNESSNNKKQITKSQWWVHNAAKRKRFKTKDVHASALPA